MTRFLFTGFIRINTLAEYRKTDWTVKGKSGGTPRIRTETVRDLNALPLPNWGSVPWCYPWDSNPQQRGPQPRASSSCARIAWCREQESNLQTLPSKGSRFSICVSRHWWVWME